MKFRLMYPFASIRHQEIRSEILNNFLTCVYRSSRGGFEIQDFCVPSTDMKATM